MKVIKNIIAGLVLVLFAVNAIAAEEESKTKKPMAKLRGPAEFQKVIDDYKAYVAKIRQKLEMKLLNIESL